MTTIETMCSVNTYMLDCKTVFFIDWICLCKTMSLIETKLHKRRRFCKNSRNTHFYFSTIQKNRKQLNPHNILQRVASISQNEFTIMSEKPKNIFLAQSSLHLRTIQITIDRPNFFACSWHRNLRRPYETAQFAIHFVQINKHNWQQYVVVLSNWTVGN